MIEDTETQLLKDHANMISKVEPVNQTNTLRRPQSV